MINMEPIYKTIDSKAWYCISIFYSREGWQCLLTDILSYYSNNSDLLHCCLIYFSEHKGEHIRVTFSSDIHNANILQNKINDHFQAFLRQQPSKESKITPFGKELWGYHKNNTFIWNGYEIQYEESKMSQNFTLLMPYLFGDDTSIENLYSIAMFLSLKLLKSISVDNRLEVLNTISKKYAFYFENIINDSSNDLQNESLLDIISDYWELKYDDEQSINIFNQWASSADDIMFSFPVYLGYSRLVGIICKHLGLDASYSLLIVSSIKQWYENSIMV